MDFKSTALTTQPKQKKSSPAGFEPARVNPVDFKSTALTTRPK
ncbi:hypothetical protein pb186bvf_006835 [Paramecium bursaria]